jgi:hypothetical protein
LLVAAMQSNSQDSQGKGSIAPLASREESSSGEGQVQLIAVAPPVVASRTDGQTGAAVETGTGPGIVVPGQPGDPPPASTAIQYPVASALALSPYRSSDPALASNPNANSSTGNPVAASTVRPTSESEAPNSDVQHVPPGNSGITSVTSDRPSPRNTSDVSTELSSAGASRAGNGLTLLLALIPDDTSDPVRELFHAEGSDSKVRTYNLASALAEAQRGSFPPPWAAPVLTIHPVKLDLGRSDMMEDGGEETGLGPWAWAGALTIAQMLEPVDDSPYEVDLLASTLSQDTTCVEQAIEQCLDRVDGLGGILIDLLTSERLRPWLHGAALAAVGCVVARRLRRKGKSDAHEGAGTYDPESPLLVDWHLEET